jgi:hypothetical protein
VSEYERALKAYRDRFPHTFGWQTATNGFYEGWIAVLNAIEAHRALDPAKPPKAEACE